MDGIIFIQQFTKNYNSPTVYNILIGLSIILLMSTFIVKKDMAIFSCAFGGLLAFAIGLSLAITPNTHLYHQVLLENNIDIKEFSQKYEIVEQQGISYIIKEKQNGDN
jgi:hypothetical protein